MSEGKQEPRSLYTGLLGPGERRTITIDAPLTDEQQPVLITPMRDGALIVGCAIGSDKIEILSKWQSSTPFALAVVPKEYMRAAMLPWRDALSKLAGAVGDVIARMKNGGSKGG